MILTNDGRNLELLLEDLTPEAQAEFLKFQELETTEEGNLEYMPLTIFEKWYGDDEEDIDIECEDDE